MLGMYQFALVEMEIHDQYTQAKSRFWNCYQFQALSTSNSFSLNTINPQSLPSSTQKIEVGNLLQVQI